MFTRQSSSSNGSKSYLSITQRGRASIDVPSSLPSSLSLPLLSLSPVNAMAATRPPSSPLRPTEEQPQSSASSMHSSATLPSIRSFSTRFFGSSSKNGKKMGKATLDSHKSIGDVFSQNVMDQSLDPNIGRQEESSLGLTGHEHVARMVFQPALRPSAKLKRKSYDLASIGRPSFSSRRTNTAPPTAELDEAVLDVRHPSPPTRHQTPLASPFPLPMPSLETLPPPNSMSTTSFSTATTPPAPETPSSFNPDSPTPSEDNPDASLNITRVIDLSMPHISVSPSPPPAQDKRVSALAKELSEVIKERGLESLLQALSAEEQKSPPTHGRSLSVEPDSSYVVSSPERDMNGDAIVKAGRQKRWTLQEMGSALEKMGSIVEGARGVPMIITSPSVDLAPPTPDTGASSPLSPPSSGGQDVSFAASSHLEIDAHAIDEHLEKRFGEGWAERMILGDTEEHIAEETIKQELQLKPRDPQDIDTPKVDAEGFDADLAKLLSPNGFVSPDLETPPSEMELEELAPTSTSTPVKETRGRLSMIFTAATPESKDDRDHFRQLDRATPTAITSSLIIRSRSNTPTPTESSASAASSVRATFTTRKKPPPPLPLIMPDLDFTPSSPSPVRRAQQEHRGEMTPSAPGSPISSRRRSIQSVQSLQRAPSTGDATSPMSAPNWGLNGMVALGVAGGRRPGKSPLLTSRTIQSEVEDAAHATTARSVSLKLGRERDMEKERDRRSLDVGGYHRPATSTAHHNTPHSATTTRGTGAGRSPFLNQARREELMPPRSVTSLGRINREDIPPRSLTSLGSASPFKVKGSADYGHTAPLPLPPRVFSNVVGRTRRGYSVDEGAGGPGRDRSATVSSTSTSGGTGNGLVVGPLTRRAFAAAGLLDMDVDRDLPPNSAITAGSSPSVAARDRDAPWREMPTSAGTSGSGGSGSGGHIGTGGTGSEFSVETGRTSVSGAKHSNEDNHHASPITPSTARTLYAASTTSSSAPTLTSSRSAGTIPTTTTTNTKRNDYHHHAQYDEMHTIQSSTSLRNLRERHEESIRLLRSQHDEALRTLRQQHEESTCELRTTHEEVIQQLKEQNEDTVQLLKERHDLEKDALLSALSESKRSLARAREEHSRLEKYVRELEERLTGALDLNRRSEKAVSVVDDVPTSRLRQTGRRVATISHARTQSSATAPAPAPASSGEGESGARLAARRFLVGRVPERAVVGKGHPNSNSLRPVTPTSRLTASVGAGVLRNAGLPVSDHVEDITGPGNRVPRHRRSVASESSIVLPTPSRMLSMLFDVPPPIASAEFSENDDEEQTEFGLDTETETENLGAMGIQMTTTPPSPSFETRPIHEGAVKGASSSPSFSFSMRSASPASLRLRLEDEIHLADLGSILDERERDYDDDEYEEDQSYYYDDGEVLDGGRYTALRA